MPHFHLKKIIQQLPPQQGGYYYVLLDTKIVQQYTQKEQTHLRCHLDNKIAYPCSFNKLDEDQYYIIIAAEHLQELDKKIGDIVHVMIYKDPHPIGIEIPEFLLVLLEQDETSRVMYRQLTEKQRVDLIKEVALFSDINQQKSKTLQLLQQHKK